MSNPLIPAPTTDLLPLLERIEGAETDVNRAIVRAITRVMHSPDLPRRERVKLVDTIASLGRTEYTPVSDHPGEPRRSTVEQLPRMLEPGNAPTTPGQANRSTLDARTAAPTGAVHATTKRDKDFR